MHIKHLNLYLAGLLCLLTFLASSLPAQAVWHDSAARFRRAVQVNMEDAKITGEELAGVKFLGNGKQHPDGSDVRVMTNTGKPVPSRVIYAGPGDQLEVVFNVLRATRHYYVYFGNPTPAPSDDSKLNKVGLLMELKPLTLAGEGTPRDMQRAFDSGPAVIGRRMIQRPFYGSNTLTGPDRLIARITGRLFTPVPGAYTFAVSANERACLFIDDKPLVFSRRPVNDTRFQERTQLERGWHDFAVYHVNTGGEFMLSVGWKRPDMQTFEVIGREFFGLVAGTTPGALEEKDQTLTADFSATYLGEAFFANNYSHRYRFDLATTAVKPDRVHCVWDFGDGQTATGIQAEHVFVHAATYDVRVTTTLGNKSDTQTFRFRADRDMERADRPAIDDVGMHSRLVGTYDLTKLTADDAAWAVLMHLRVPNIDAAIAAARRVAEVNPHPTKSIAIKALGELIDEMERRKSVDPILGILQLVPAKSDLNPYAAIEQAGLLLWDRADFAGAIRVIEPFAKTDNGNAKRVYGQALLLAGRLDDARKTLEAIPVAANPQKAAALSGAMARTTEFYVGEKDAEHGDQAWDKWMTAFPADFLEGNSIVMRVKLIETRGRPEVAAKVAEAFANANPQSSYSPRLLDTASTLLAKSDAAKSAALRILLKQRYPEDPLSQP